MNLLSRGPNPLSCTSFTELGHRPNMALPTTSASMCNANSKLHVSYKNWSQG